MQGFPSCLVVDEIGFNFSCNPNTGCAGEFQFCQLGFGSGYYMAIATIAAFSKPALTPRALFPIGREQAP